jgi:hypothetical protein
MQTSTVIIRENSFLNPGLRANDPDQAATPSTFEALVDIDPDRIGSLTRIEDRLVMLFQDGSQLTIENFFLFEERYQRCLKEMSRDGDIWPALLADSAPTEELKYNFSQPATAWVFGGSALLAGAALRWLW